MPRFDEWTLKEARKPLEGLATTDLAANRKFYRGDHFQDGQGWPVDDVLPSGVLRTDFLLRLKRSFVSENMIASVIETHVGAILGREPSWDAVPDEPLPDVQDGEEAVTEAIRKQVEAARATILETAEAIDGELDQWWHQRRVLSLLEDAAEKLLYGAPHAVTGHDVHVVVRFYIPAGLLTDDTDEAGRRLPPPVSTLQEALDLLYIEVLEPEQALVTTDPDTERQVGVYLYKRERKVFAELSYLTDNGQTRLRVVNAAGEVGSVDREMDGNLWHYQLTRSPFITEQVRQLQRALNLTLTVMSRNQYTAGFPARFFLDAFPPGAYFERDETTGRYELKVSADNYLTGPGIDNFIGASQTIEETDERGEPTRMRYGSPSVYESRPVEMTTFKEAREVLREAILGECDQLHTLISGDATASGKSRQQALADFLRSLGETATQINGLVTWILETALRVALDILGNDELKKRYAGFHFDASCQLDLGPLDPEMLRVLVELWEKGFLSHETALMVSRLVDDYLGEMSRIKTEKAESLANLERRVLVAQQLFNMRGGTEELKAAGLPNDVIEALEGTEQPFPEQ